MAEASVNAASVSVGQLKESIESTSVIFVDTSQDFAEGHLPGSRWVPRGWLELEIADVVEGKETPIVVTCADGPSSTLAAATLTEMGYGAVSVLEGGIDAWRSAGLSLETGLSGVMKPPTDVVLAGIDRNYAEMIHYLRWEEALGARYRPS